MQPGAQPHVVSSIAALLQLDADHRAAVEEQQRAVFNRLSRAFVDPDEQGYEAPPNTSSSPSTTSSPLSTSTISLADRTAEVGCVLSHARAATKRGDSVAHAACASPTFTVTLDVNAALDAALADLGGNGADAPLLYRGLGDVHGGGVVALLDSALDAEVARVARERAPPSPPQRFSLADAGLDSLPAFLSLGRGETPSSGGASSAAATSASAVPSRFAPSPSPVLTRREMKARSAALAADSRRR